MHLLFLKNITKLTVTITNKFLSISIAYEFLIVTEAKKFHIQGI